MSDLLLGCLTVLTLLGLVAVAIRLAADVAHWR